MHIILHTRAFMKHKENSTIERFDQGWKGQVHQYKYKVCSYILVFHKKDIIFGCQQILLQIQWLYQPFQPAKPTNWNII